MAKKRIRSARLPDHRRKKEVLEAELKRAYALWREGRAEEALAVLRALEQRYPDRPEVLRMLADIHADRKDTAAYLITIRRLHALQPEDPDVTLGLASGYALNRYFSLAYRFFQQFLQKWPNHPMAKEITRMLRDLEKGLQEEAKHLEMPLEDALPFMTQHDEMILAVRTGDTPKAQQLAEQLRQRYPRFVSPLNNLSLAYWVSGDRARAIATARQVLEIAPENVHALGNLIYFHYLSGQEEEARALLPRLKAASIRKADEWTKKLEMFTLLGEEEDVLVFGQQALASEGTITEASFHCFLAAAKARKGDIKSAQKHWKEALKWDPGNLVALKNLENIRKKPQERFVPWAIPMEVWIDKETVLALAQKTGAAFRKKSDQGIEAILQHLLDNEHPELLRLAPAILNRGSPEAKDFVMKMAEFSAHPTLLAALKDYAFGQYDPLSVRMQAAMLLSHYGIIPKGMAQFWVDGEWRSMLVVSFTLTDEPSADYPLKPAADQHLKRALQALYASDGPSAEKHLRNALAIQPNHPSLLNNLAFALMLQGKDNEALEIVHRVAEEFPDYFFAQITLAREAIQRGDLNKAREILDHWMITKEVFHFSEFSMFCQAQIDLVLAEGNSEAAESWLQMWEQVYSDDRKLPYYRTLVREARRTGRWGEKKTS